MLIDTGSLSDAFRPRPINPFNQHKIHGLCDKPGNILEVLCGGELRWFPRDNITEQPIFETVIFINLCLHHHHCFILFTSRLVKSKCFSSSSSTHLQLLQSISIQLINFTLKNMAAVIEAEQRISTVTIEGVVRCPYGQQYDFQLLLLRRHELMLTLLPNTTLW